MTAVGLTAAFAGAPLSCGTETGGVSDGGTDAGVDMWRPDPPVDLRSDPDPCLRFETVVLDIDGSRVRLMVSLPCDRTPVLRDLGDPVP